MLFTFFGVPVQYQRRVLILGIIGAIILRAIMILIGAWLITKFDWILYLFGLFLLVTGVKMLMMAEAESDLEQNPLLRWMRRHVPITKEFHGESFPEDVSNVIAMDSNYSRSGNKIHAAPQLDLGFLPAKRPFPTSLFYGEGCGRAAKNHGGVDNCCQSLAPANSGGRPQCSVEELAVHGAGGLKF